MVYILVLRCLHERVMRQCYAVERQCYVVVRQCCVVVQQCMAVLWCCAVVSTEKARQVQSTADVMLLQTARSSRSRGRWASCTYSSGGTRRSKGWVSSDNWGRSRGSAFG